VVEWSCRGNQAGQSERPSHAKKTYLAIIFISGGSSWAEDSAIDKAVKSAAKLARFDWGGIFDMKKTKLRVNVFDATGHPTWHATHEGVFGTNNAPLKKIKTVDA